VAGGKKTRGVRSGGGRGRRYPEQGLEKREDVLENGGFPISDVGRGSTATGAISVEQQENFQERRADRGGI